MLTLHPYQVLPYIPPPLEPLLKLAKNLWWSWNQEARAVFARIDPVVYERVGHNPMALLAKVPQRRLDVARRHHHVTGVQHRQVAGQHDRPSGMLLSRPTTFLARLPAPC